MKYFIITLLLSWAISAAGQGVAAPERIALEDGWTFAEEGKGEWRTAEVPGTVHGDLLRHGLLPDPFYGKNEEKIQWVEEHDWHYRTTFTLTREQAERTGADLVFEGLDTYADVYLNGALVLRGDNMFVGYRIPVREVLQEGENRLYIVFHSPIRMTLPQWETNGFEYPADNDHAERRVSVFSRKAPYSYGWDWGIRMATSGVWREARLELYDEAAITDFYVRQVSVDAEQATVSNELEIIHPAGKSAKAETEAEVEVQYSIGGKALGSVRQQITLKQGKNEVAIEAQIDKPELWMPNGWGKATLYDFTATVKCEGVTVAEEHRRVGLRTVRVVNEPDAEGESFYFEVNGVPMFAKGANYIPMSPLLPEVTEAQYRELFRSIREANMNMVRVWGGGVYEDDLFYELADENGILVWQDFMFACTTYPADPVFLKRVEAEAEYNIKRLRGHACLAMWCGNNEVAEGIKYWGWKKRFSPEVYNRFLEDYHLLFEEVLPAQVARWDKGRFYIHTSPYCANWGRPETWRIGDSHNWGTWYGEKPFESADEEPGRFISEYGFQSLPEMKTIATFAAPEDYALESEVMRAHQKSTTGNSLIRKSMERYFQVPERFEDFVYVGLVLQGQGIRHCIEAHRRFRPYCMGSLYWQLNDSWPVVSWSGIDYYGNWKALHYEARRAFAPVYLNLFEEGDSLRVHVFSDLLEEIPGATLALEAVDFNGKRGKRTVVKTDIPANSNVTAYCTTADEWAPGEAKNRCFLKATLKDKQGKTVAENVYYFVPTKDLQLPDAEVQFKVKGETGRCIVTLSSKKLVKSVFLEVGIQGAQFSDNFFDLLPGERKTVVITAPGIWSKDVLEIKIKHIGLTMKD